MPAPPISPSLLESAADLAPRSLYGTPSHFEEIGPGIERDPTDIQEVHRVLPAAVESAVHEKAHTHNGCTLALLGLANEIWAEIWGKLPMQDRVTATHVCRNWRDLAIASPTLWSDIEFEYCCSCVPDDPYRAYYTGIPFTCRMDGSPHADHSAHSDYTSTDSWTNLDSLRAILDRGLAPLRFSLSISGEHADCTEDFLTMLAETLQPHVHRLVSLELSGTSQQSVDLPLFLSQAGPDFPRLVRLDVNNFRTDGESDLYSPMSTSMDDQALGFRIPALRTAVLYLYAHWCEPFLLKSQVAPVRTLTFCPNNLSAAVGMLRAYPQLRSLCLNFMGYTASTSVSAEAIPNRLDHALEEVDVDELSIEVSNQDAATRLLDILLRPSQRSIELGLVMSKDLKFASSPLVKFMIMFADLSRERGNVTNTGLRITTWRPLLNHSWKLATSESRVVVDLWVLPTKDGSYSYNTHRRALTLNNIDNLEEALAPIWRNLDASVITEFKLKSQGSYYPPFPLVQASPNSDKGRLLLPRLKRFTLAKPEGTSFDSIRAIDWSAALPKACTFKVQFTDEYGREQRELLFENMGLFLSWLSGNSDYKGKVAASR